MRCAQVVASVLLSLIDLIAQGDVDKMNLAPLGFISVDKGPNVYAFVYGFRLETGLPVLPKP
jgi:hypothetical protein